MACPSQPVLDREVFRDSRPPVSNFESDAVRRHVHHARAARASAGEDVERVILEGLQQRMMAPELVEEFITAFTEEVTGSAGRKGRRGQPASRNVPV